VVVSHAEPLIRELRREPQTRVVELVKELGETRLRGVERFDGPVWNWGHR